MAPLARCHPGRHQKTVWKHRLVFCGFGALLDAFWHPFRRHLAILEAFWPPSSCLFGSLWKFFGPPRTCRDFAENLPKFSRELLGNSSRAALLPSSLFFYRFLMVLGCLWTGMGQVPPRIRQEPAKNPPYEPQAKLSFTLRLL